MKSKTFCLVLGILFAASLFSGSDVFAGKQNSGGSSRSSSPRTGSPYRPSKPPGTFQGGYGNSGTRPDQSGKSTGQGYGNTGSKPSGSSFAPKGSSGQPSGYGNTAVPGQAGSPAGAGQARSPSQMTPLQSRMNKGFSKQESAKAYEDYKAQQGRFKSAGGYNPSGRENSTAESIRSRSGYNYGSDYYPRRTVFYDNYGWSAPVYIYHSYPRFGIWDAMILWFMLDHINDAQYAAMYYNHRDDPGMQQFRAEAERLSAENTELKDKLAKLDESSKTMEQQGVKPDPTYVPQDAAGVALAADVVKAEPPKSSSGSSVAWIIGIALFALFFFMLARRKR